MLNRKMVFRVTKSQSMKDKLSFIWYYMIILTGGWRVGGWGVVGGQYTCVFRRSEWKWVQISQQKRSQILLHLFSKQQWCRNVYKCAPMCTNVLRCWNMCTIAYICTRVCKCTNVYIWTDSTCVRCVQICEQLWTEIENIVQHWNWKMWSMCTNMCTNV